MPKFYYLAFIIKACLICSSAQGQKLKYKDIFPELDAKNYEVALPKLEAFLAEPKNSDHPNGNYQMAIYYDQIVDKSHLIKDSTAILEASAKALEYFTKAKEYITEKELKKNDDFYQSFYRRDLRTGEFGIKISDVHLDIEKKIESMEALQKYGKEIFKKLQLANKSNAFCTAAYKNLFQRFESYNDLLLMVGEPQIDTLKEMADRESIMKDAFDDVRRAVSKIGKKGYSPELNLVAIETYGVDGLTEVDVFQNDVEAWEYGEWAYGVVKKIEGEIGELRTQLLAFDKKIKKENESLKGLEDIAFETLTHEIDPYIVEKLADLDEDPLPVDLFMIQIKKNEYDFMVNPERNTRIGNLDDVDFQLMFTDSLVSVLELMEKDVAKLQENYVLQGQKKYTNFIKNQYGGDFGILKIRKAYEEFFANSKEKWIMLNREYTERAKWGIAEDESDTIFLDVVADSLKADLSVDEDLVAANYTVAIDRDDESNIYVVGIDKKNVGKGFVAMVSNARKIVWKEPFELGRFTYNDSTELVKGKFVPSQEGKLTAYVYTSAKNLKKVNLSSNLVVVNADKVGQVAWTNEIVAKNEPVEVKFNELVKETVLYMMTEEEMESAGPEDTAYYVIDRSGKLR
ncbi:hypothetical protein [Reichenbachiella versicolor]|uniref:hypothetical protein n=1 Tax=Reichenbachiella versicolor TaxID=1821036 RepID=UPI000D6EADA8|nr:hypothetical protein [Reichenbachiella versicolor]